MAVRSTFESFALNLRGFNRFEGHDLLSYVPLDGYAFVPESVVLARYPSIRYLLFYFLGLARTSWMGRVFVCTWSLGLDASSDSGDGSYIFLCLVVSIDLCVWRPVGCSGLSLLILLSDCHSRQTFTNVVSEQRVLLLFDNCGQLSNRSASVVLFRYCNAEASIEEDNYNSNH